MDFDKLIEKRHSVRDFQKLRKASWKNVLEAIDAANNGPFAGNINNLKFVIIESPATIGKLAKHAKQTWIANSDIVVAVCSDNKHIENVYGERGRLYAKQQVGAAIMSLILKLENDGLGACWVGAFTDELVRKTIKIPDKIEVEALIPIGYEKQPARAKPKVKKEPLESTIYWEEWKKGRRPTVFSESTRDI